MTRLPSAIRERPAPRTAPSPAPPAAPRPAGHYHFDRDSDRWSWSVEMSALLGLSPGAAPCAGLLITAAHPDDRPRCREAIERVCSGGVPFALPVTLGGQTGAARHAVLVGEPVVATGGRVAGVAGLLVEVPGSGVAPPDGDERVRALEAEVAQLRTAMRSRAVIEQAKGALMLLTSCSEQAAFDLLAHVSSHTHRKLRDVAVTVTESASGRAPLPADVRDLIRDACPPAAPAP